MWAQGAREVNKIWCRAGDPVGSVINIFMVCEGVCKLILFIMS